MEWDQDLIGGGECIDSDHSQGGRRVDKDIIIVVRDSAQRLFEDKLALGATCYLKICPREVDGGWDKIKVGYGCFLPRLRDTMPLHEDCVGILVHLSAINSKTTCRIALRIRVHQ